MRKLIEAIRLHRKLDEKVGGSEIMCRGIMFIPDELPSGPLQRCACSVDTEVNHGDD